MVYGKIIISSKENKYTVDKAYATFKRVVEYIAIERETKRAALYIDGKLIAQHSQEQQSIER